jgi:E3 ubiquitin-protein ligase EDD1
VASSQTSTSAHRSSTPTPPQPPAAGSASTGPASSSAAQPQQQWSSLSALGDLGVRQIEVGPSHFAFLLQDGRICRLPFSVISDRLDLSRNPNSSSSAAGGNGGGSGGGTSMAGGSGGSGGVPKSSYKTPQGASTSSSSLGVRAPARTRGRIIRTSSIRGRTSGSSPSGAVSSGSIIMSSSRPAPYVPEDLVGI